MVEGCIRAILVGLHGNYVGLLLLVMMVHENLVVFGFTLLQYPIGLLFLRSQLINDLTRIGLLFATAAVVHLVGV